jgi:hypothetical protein
MTSSAMPTPSFHQRFIAFGDLNRRRRELELLGQSDPNILNRWHEALNSLTSCYQQARDRELVIKGLSDPYFPLSKLRKLNVEEFSREPDFADFSKESLARISAKHLLCWAEIFLSIRQDLKNLNNHGEISTMRLLDPPQEPLPEPMWCEYCGGCCEIRGGVPEFSGRYRPHSLWYVYFRGDGCEYQRFCPFLFEYFATAKFFCAIYEIKPKCCWEFDREECEFLHKDVARERRERARVRSLAANRE